MLNLFPLSMNRRYTSLCAVALLALGTISQLSAQEARYYNPVIAAVPSLQITPDARAAGMGDLGVATTPDPYAQHWNPSKFAFLGSSSGISLGYTPWLSRLVSDIALMHLGGYYKFGADKEQALGASLRYFTMGKLTSWDASGRSLGESHPNEFALDASYSRKLSADFSMAVALRYVHSDQGAREQGGSAGNAFAADVAGYLHKYLTLGSAESLWTLGFNVRNIGTKISFDSGATSAFLPTNLALGTGLLYPLDDHNLLSVNVEANKLLVPTPPVDRTDASKLEEYAKISSIAGIFKSLGDAPGGFSEEMKEIRWSIGAEYSYNDKFFVRAGYSYLHPDKGNLQAFTAGAGFRLNAFRIDASYLMSTIANNPLDQTLRFTLAFDMAGVRELFK